MSNVDIYFYHESVKKCTIAGCKSEPVQFIFFRHSNGVAGIRPFCKRHCRYSDGTDMAFETFLLKMGATFEKILDEQEYEVWKLLQC